MDMEYNIYCDESCHLENDHQKVMVLGAVWCPKEKAREIMIRLREIKVKHGLSKRFEIKWTKVSPAKLDFYLEVLDYFFDDDDLHFRGLIIPDKTKLDHAAFSQTHDDWYYKMYFDMLKILFRPSSQYYIYVDIKDTRGAQKISKLHDVLCNNVLDFDRSIIARLQLVKSHEIEILQLTDLLIGALSYIFRDCNASSAKLAIINRLKSKTNYSLLCSTLLLEEKFNIFKWRPKER